MQINNLRDFLVKLFSIYSVGSRNTAELLETYFELIYTPNQKYNYEKTLKDIFNEYTYRTIPSGAFIIEKLENNKIKNITDNKISDGKIIAFKRNKKGEELEYEFAYGGNCCLPLETAKKVLLKKGLFIKKIESN